MIIYICDKLKNKYKNYRFFELIGKEVRILCSPRYCKADETFKATVIFFTGRKRSKMKLSQETCL